MHLTESCLLKVTHDITMASDAGDCSVWVLLDLSSAFDTVDLTLDWVSSYVTIEVLQSLQRLCQYMSDVFFGSVFSATWSGNCRC